MKITLHIEGMMCQHCSARVEKALQAVPGVQSVKVSLADKSAVVEGEADHAALAQAVQDAGYQIVMPK